jgi:hypothetical protein
MAGAPAGGSQSATASRTDVTAAGKAIEHDPEKWEPVFGKDHAQTKS